MTEEQAAQIALLNQQMAAMRAQLAALQVALDAAEQADTKDKVQITDLGKQLNEALARRLRNCSNIKACFSKPSKPEPAR